MMLYVGYFLLFLFVLALLWRGTGDGGHVLTPRTCMTPMPRKAVSYDTTRQTF